MVRVHFSDNGLFCLGSKIILSTIKEILMLGLSNLEIVFIIGLLVELPVLSISKH